MTDYLFIINDTDGELKQRVSEKYWPLNPNTSYVSDLEKGDRVIIYRGGNNHHTFIGKAEIAGTATKDKVELSKIQLWDQPVEINKVINNLEIIKNPIYYGVYLAGGVKRLSERDFKTLENIGERSA